MAKTKTRGTIIQLEKEKTRSRCRKWQLRVNTGKDPSTGKYTARTRRFGGTYTEAVEALEKFAAELDGGLVQSRTDWTFDDYAAHYLEIRVAKREVEPSTIKKQHDQFKAIGAHIGKTPIESVTPKMIEDAYIAMLNGDTLSGRPSGGSYVNQIHDNVTLVFEHAKKEGFLVKNPCDEVVPPKMDTKPKKALTKDIAAFLAQDLDPATPRECAYLLALTLGLRRGEICGLSWEDVDFTQHLVNIRHSVDTLGNLKGTKTKAGVRILPLPDLTWRALQERMVSQKLQFAKTNSYRKPEEGYLEQNPSTAVITGYYGQRLYPSTLSRWWSEDRAGYGLENFTLHELRHTYMTLLAYSGVHPKIMQELAGHYSCQITMDIYTHVNMAAKRQAVGAVSNLFPETTSAGELPAVGQPIVLDCLV